MVPRAKRGHLPPQYTERLAASSSATNRDLSFLAPVPTACPLTPRVRSVSAEAVLCREFQMRVLRFRLGETDFRCDTLPRLFMRLIKKLVYC